jgi:hypothetical protein
MARVVARSCDVNCTGFTRAVVWDRGDLDDTTLDFVGNLEVTWQLIRDDD